MSSLEDKDYILSTLQKYKEHAESQGLQVYAVALKGSQNYNLSDKESDIDANLVFIPTFRQLREDSKYKFEFETGAVVCHNIYKFAEILSKGNPQWVEVCNSEFTIGDLSLFSEFKVNPSALKGMVMEKVHAFDKLYPSSKKEIEQFGWSPKQLHHIVRLYDVLSKDVKSYKYSDEEKPFMMDLKRGRYPTSLKVAEELRDEYTVKLDKIYEERKITYEQQSIDYSIIDKIMKEHICKHL